MNPNLLVVRGLDMIIMKDHWFGQILMVIKEKISAQDLKGPIYKKFIYKMKMDNMKRRKSQAIQISYAQNA